MSSETQFTASAAAQTAFTRVRTRVLDSDYLRVALPIWLTFTLLRFWVATMVEYLVQPNHGRLDQGWIGVLKLPTGWDSGYYLAIARDGYFGAESTVQFQAFFPGYPLAARLLTALTTFEITDARLMVGAALVSSASSLIATLLLFSIARSVWGRRAAVFAIIMLMAWPSASFLTAAYSESLYLALAVGAWWFARRGQWWWAGALCAGASFTRVNGLFLVIALLVMLIVHCRRSGEWLTVGKLAAVSLGSAGAVGYLGYLWIKTGDPMAWQHAQYIGWARETVAPWTALTQTIENIRTIDEPFRQMQWILDIAAVVFCLGAASVMARRRLWPEFTLTALTIISLITSTSYMSITRNTLTIFPLFLIGGAVLAHRKEWVSTMLLTLSAVAMCATTAAFTLGRWVG